MMNPLVQALTRISFCTSEFIFVRRHREYLPRHAAANSRSCQPRSET